MSKIPTPVVDWMHKRDLDGVLRIEESLYAWEGWSEKKLLSLLREKNVIGMVAKVCDVVAAYVVYDFREKEMFFLKFGVAPELKMTRAGHVLMEYMKKKGQKYKKSLQTILWEGESIDTFQFFAKEGFKSKLKKNFFLSQNQFVPDGIDFFWNINENMAETTNYDDFTPADEGKWRKR